MTGIDSISAERDERTRASVQNKYIATPVYTSEGPYDCGHSPAGMPGIAGSESGLKSVQIISEDISWMKRRTWR